MNILMPFKPEPAWLADETKKCNEIFCDLTASLHWF